MLYTYTGPKDRSGDCNLVVICDLCKDDYTKAGARGTLTRLNDAVSECEECGCVNNYYTCKRHTKVEGVKVGPGWHLPLVLKYC